MKTTLAVPSLLFLAWLTTQPLAAKEIDYDTIIRPLLSEKCSACHGALRQEAGLRLDHGQLLREGGDDGSIIDFEDVGNSRLLQRVSTADPSERMPPEGEGEPLSAVQLRWLQEWLAAGAVSPAEEPIPVGPDQHWAWQVPEQVLPPKLENESGSTNPIDAFVLAQQMELGIKPLPLADARTRLRRLYFDVIGLPPTLQQQREFLADTSAAAWQNVVNRLLDDPAHGQRWARHWMDVWRYSDWDGYKQQVRGSQRHIWRWRDWIVESLNEDKGYDQMIREMLAGDELSAEDPDVLRATGFLVRNYHNSNRNIWLDATVEHTAKAFLATTINCARCHDHKYDPISQREYYAFRAIFEPHQARTERVEGQPDKVKDGLVRAYDKHPAEPTYLFVGGNEKAPDQEHPVSPAAPSIAQIPFEVTPVKLPEVAVFPALRGYVEREDLAAAAKELEQAKLSLAELPAEADESALDFKLAKQSVNAATAKLASLQARWRADKARFGPATTRQQVGAARQEDGRESQATTEGRDAVQRPTGSDSAGSDSANQPTGPQWDALRWSAATLEYTAKLESAKLSLLQKQKALSEIESGKAKSEKEHRSAIDKARKELEAAQKQLDALAEKPSDGVSYTSVGPIYPAVSTGRRSALARWITHPSNPLTARVAVNYIWMHHFGEPLVDNVFDFGMRSPEPLHRQLLDWLAVELMENNWSMKHLHRLILTSHVYQLASFSAQDVAQVAVNRRLDPDNRFLWRANVRRLEAEVVRDSLLHVAGNLDCTSGGPDIDYQDGEKVPRRSVYFRHAYEKQMTMLVVFDAAGPTECYRRSTSVVPQQALALSNSPLGFDQSRLLAARLDELAHADEEPHADGDLERFIVTAFEVLLARQCTAEELRNCQEFLVSQAQLLANTENLTPLPGQAKGTTEPASDAKRRAKESFIHALMNHNDFVTIR